MRGNLGKKMGISGRFVSDVYTTYGVTGYDGRASNSSLRAWICPKSLRTVFADGDGSKGVSLQPGSGDGPRQPWNHRVGQRVTLWVPHADKTAGFVHHTATGASASGTNIFIAATADETDYYNKCLPVQLPAGAIRAALNLQANPGNLGMVVTLNGSLEKYFGLPGVKTVTPNMNLTDRAARTPANLPAGDGDGTEDKTLCHFAGGGLGNPEYSRVGQGLHRGFRSRQDCRFVHYCHRCVRIRHQHLHRCHSRRDRLQQMSARAAFTCRRRACGASNLQANPGNLGKEVVVYGSLEAYFGLPGIKSVSQYKIDGQGGGATLPIEPVDPCFVAQRHIRGRDRHQSASGWSLKNVIGNKSWYFTSFEENSYAAHHRL